MTGADVRSQMQARLHGRLHQTTIPTNRPTTLAQPQQTPDNEALVSQTMVPSRTPMFVTFQTLVTGRTCMKTRLAASNRISIVRSKTDAVAVPLAWTALSTLLHGLPTLMTNIDHETEATDMTTEVTTRAATRCAQCLKQELMKLRYIPRTLSYYFDVSPVLFFFLLLSFMASMEREWF